MQQCIMPQQLVASYAMAFPWECVTNAHAVLADRIVQKQIECSMLSGIIGLPPGT